MNSINIFHCDIYKFTIISYNNIKKWVSFFLIVSLISWIRRDLNLRFKYKYKLTSDWSWNLKKNIESNVANFAHICKVRLQPNLQKMNKNNKMCIRHNEIHSRDSYNR